MNTHYAVCSAYIPIKNLDLDYEGSINFTTLLEKVAQEGYFPGKNMSVLKDKLVFHMDDGTNLIIYMQTIH